jgi:hypothetical protein
MRLLILLFSFGLAVASSTPVEAAAKKKHVARKAHRVTSSKTAKAKKQIPARGHLQTDVSFDDSVLRGQYQSPDDALARVENEKGLSDLLGVRKHFKDRLQTAAEQE